MSLMNDREQRRLLAEETLNTVDRGKYDITIEIKEGIEYCVRGTQYYPPGTELENRGYRYIGGPRINVRPLTTLEAAQQLCEHPARVGVLNFASGKNPGGGFLRGTSAQEESLARSSALYRSLTQEQCKPYYDTNRESRDPRYNDAMIWSPACPVFRNDAGNLLPQPYIVDIVTCAAPNYSGVLESGKFEGDGTGLREEIMGLFEYRAYKMLRLFSHHEVPVLVLGAWGCGVFGNDPAMVATILRKLLLADFKDMFEKIVFAIPPGHNEGVFLRTFGGDLS